MAKKKKFVSPSPNAQLYLKEDQYVTSDGKTINAGDLIKVKGEYGTKFKFIAYVKHTISGATWVDCLELERGVARAFRSFREDRIKPIHIPKRRNKKRVA
jgi:hypothetical protein